jgi:hypothetical protein
MSTPIYGIDNTVNPAKRVASTWGIQVANLAELAAVQLARIFGAGILASTDFNASDGGSGAINISTGLAIVGAAGSEKLKLLSSIKTLANPGDGTWYVYVTQGDESDGTPTFSVTASGTPAANTHQVASVVIAAGAFSSANNAPASRVNFGAAAMTDKTQTLSGKTLSGVTIADATNVALATGTGTKIGATSTQKMGFWGATPIVRPGTWTPTNVTTDRSFDANATTLDEVADALGTLIADLKAVGLIG